MDFKLQYSNNLNKSSLGEHKRLLSKTKTKNVIIQNIWPVVYKEYVYLPRFTASRLEWV